MNMWRVPSILTKRGTGRGVRYLVRWRGYPPSEDTWETRNTLEETEALDIFEAEQQEKANQARKGRNLPKDMNSFQTVPFARKKNAASYQGEKLENAHPYQLESKKQKQERNPCMHRASYGPEKQAHSQVWNISSSSLEILILMTFCFKESKGMRNERLCLIIGWLIISWRWSPETSFSTSVDATGMCEYILPQDLW